MKIGKLTSKNLKDIIFNNIHLKRKEIIQGPNIGEDAAVLNFKDDLIAISTDPITGAVENIGKLCVDISCNDVVCACAEPVGILLSILIPPKFSMDKLKEIINDVTYECSRLNVDLIGGHTEVTSAVNKIIITSTVIGRVKKSHMIDVNSILENDLIIMSKYIGIEGTSIIFNEKYEMIKKFLNDDDIEEAKGLINLISILDEGLLAKNFNVKYMHDITEGGIYQALYEVSIAIDKKIIVNKRDISILKLTKKICDIFDINPYKLISSGSLLMIMSKKDFKNFEKECFKKNIDVKVIGNIKNGQNAFIYDDKLIELKDSPIDELYKIVQ